MAIKGLSIPVVGKYNHDGAGNVTYTDGIIAGNAVEYGVSIEAAENNPLYADNKIKENDTGTFKSGELTVNTAELTQNVSKLILGTKTNELSFTPDGATEPVTVTEQIFDDDTKSPYLGYGIVEWHQIDDVDRYRAVLLTKTFFAIPEEAATTKGENVEWQTKELTATIMRSDQKDEIYKNPWMRDAWFDDEKTAYQYLAHILGVPSSQAKAANAASYSANIGGANE